MGKKSKRPKAFSEKGPTGVPKSNVSATNPAPKLTKEPRQLTTAPQNGEIGSLQLAELARLIVCGSIDILQYA